MSNPKKRVEKAKSRERARRVERQRRQDKDRCSELMFQVEDAWKVDDLERCNELLNKVLFIRPNFSEALEWSAQTAFRRNRFEEVLAYYDRLREPPEYPPIIFFAAVAAQRVGQIARSQQLLTEFRSDISRQSTFPSTWKAARLLAKDLKRADSFKRPMVRIKDSAEQDIALKSKKDPAAEEPIPMAKKAVEIPVRPDPVTTKPQVPTPDPALPSFPEFKPPRSDVIFEFDKTVSAAEQDTITLAAEVFIRRDYVLLTLQKGFDELLSLGAVSDVEHFWYQLETARRVLRDFRGRALLADEVGLGKTIEAALALKEYMMRGLVRKALILTPPSLVVQWLEELRTKFALSPVSPETGGYARDPEKFWSGHDLIVASLALARQPANRERLAKIDYDMIIVDEAHYLKNRTTSSWQLVNELKKRFLLLLSATPVGNNLSELYNLILLLRPGLLGTEAQFRRDYGTMRKTGGASALEEPARRDKLRSLLREVMVRNTRAHIDLKLPRRLAATEKVSPGPLEAETLDQLATYIRTRYDSAPPSERLRLMMLQMQAGSSPAALKYGLREHRESGPSDPLNIIAENLGRLDRSAKAAALLALARRSREKKLVFTRFLATLEELRLMFESEGYGVSVFHGGLSSVEKESAIADFRDRSEILLSSESGGAGRNLQFCNTVINFDLPWSPVTIEQRVGRVHRIGQTRDVYVFNFCLAGSVEEYILQVLHEKINLFELVAGEIEMILGELGQEQDFSSLVMDLWARSATSDERESAFERFAQDLQRAKGQYQETHELDQAIFGEDYEA